jgi:hypothetical protein
MYLLAFKGLDGGWRKQLSHFKGLGRRDWGLGIRGWGLGIRRTYCFTDNLSSSNPQSLASSPFNIEFIGAESRFFLLDDVPY